MDLTIRPLDEGSDADLLQSISLRRACAEDLFGASSTQSLDEYRAAIIDTPYARTRRWVAEVEQMDGGSSIVGRAVLYAPQKENLDSLDVGMEIHPAFRGRGIAGALVDQALRPAIRESGRSLVTMFGEIPAEGDVDDPNAPANRIARRLGLRRRTVGVCRRLALPLEDALLDGLQDEVAAKIDGYRILNWDDEVPDKYLQQYGALMRQLDLDDPDEDLEYEAAEYPPERLRVLERQRSEAGTRCLTSVAVAADGTFAGNCEVHVQRAAGTTLGYQENTLVMPEHRGHRLGLALKIATHRRLRHEYPGLKALVTWNSHVNPWMIGINEKLGYRPIFREVGYQGRVEGA